MVRCRHGTDISGSRTCRLCRQEELGDHVAGGTASDDEDGDEWTVEQTALGDAEVQGQTTLTGGVATDGERDE